MESVAEHKMKTGSFEDLRVYRLAEDLADEVWDIALRWNEFARHTVGRQIVRSADSVGANIAEGCGRGSYQDNRRFIRVGRGSLNETRHWLRRAVRRRIMTQDEADRVLGIMNELGPRLNAYLKSIGPTNDE